MSAPLLLQARYVYGHPAAADGPAELLEDAAVAIVAGRITAVGYADDLAAIAWNAERVELGDAILLPGLVNAHTHLEFSELSAPLGERGNGFAAWIRALVAWRRERPIPSGPNAEDEHPVWQGLAELARSGTTLVGEIATPGWPHKALQSAYQPPLEPFAPAVEMRTFWELLGLRHERLSANQEAADAHLAIPWSNERVRTGLSPHAPYTVGPALLELAVARSRQHCAPLGMHLAESADEMQLLAHRDGPLVDLLREFDAWDPAQLYGTRPLDFLQQLSLAQGALVIHGNYLNDQEHAFLAQRRDRMSLVYCPRTHDYFGHPRYPLPELLARGVRVALGTDSRASNPDLSVLEEMRFVARHYPELPAETVLQLATLDGAEALGLGADRGVVAAGRLANLTAVALPQELDEDALTTMLHVDSPAIATFVHGIRVA